MDTKMHADAMPDADRATLASPAHVAETIVKMIEAAENRIATGERLEASSWKAGR
jgi:hypothetical protein